jgi:MFS family permease
MNYKAFKLRTLLPTRNYDALLAAIAGFLIIYTFSRHGGIGVSPDSVVYISVAANIHDHGTITDFTRGPMMDFPAFYPIFLSGVMFLTGLQCIQFGAVLNGLLFAALIFASGWIMERFSFRSKWYKWTLLSFIVFSPCLLEVYSMLWSETLFGILTLAFLYCCRRYFQSPSTANLLLMAFIAGLACVTRYAGITLIGTGGLLILCDTRPAFVKKIRDIILFGLSASVFLAINLVRNRLVTGTLTGYREKGVTPFLTNLHDFGNVFCDWLPLSNNQYDWGGLVGLFWILFFIAAFVFRLVKRYRVFTYENIATVYFIVYAVFILFTATFSRFEPLDSRLLSPLFIPWIWGATCWIPTWIAAWAPFKRRFVITAAVLAAIAFQVGQFLDDYDTWDGIRDAGIPGYTENDWRTSETMDYVRQHKDSLQKPGFTLYSNAEDGIWFLTGARADELPHKDFPLDVKEFLAENHFYIVWFNDGVNPDLVSVPFIAKHKKLAGEQVFKDGAVYFFTTEGNK